MFVPSGRALARPWANRSSHGEASLTTIEQQGAVILLLPEARQLAAAAVPAPPVPAAPKPAPAPSDPAAAQSRGAPRGTARPPLRAVETATDGRATGPGPAARGAVPTLALPSSPFVAQFIAQELLLSREPQATPAKANAASTAYQRSAAAGRERGKGSQISDLV